MPSSKGEPDQPDLREKIKKEVQEMEKGVFLIRFTMRVVINFFALSVLRPGA